MSFLRLRWLGRRRMIAYSAILALGGLVSMYWLFRQAMGPQGSDFLAFWSAGRMAVQGHAAAAYDPIALGAVQAEAGSREVFAFVNPPPLLLAVWPLGLAAYPVAWIVWVAATYLLWLLVTRRIQPELAWPIAAFPGALIAAWHAQTGFLTSAIQAGGALWLRERPFRAGLCFGALIVKPHLAVLVPVALVAGRQWRAVAGAALSVFGLLGTAWLAFGTETMLAYPRAWAVSDHLIKHGNDVFFLRQTTVYAMVRGIAGSGPASWAQAAATLGTAAMTWLAWRRPGPLEGKLALLFAATPLATPYLFAYDLPFLIIPVCWLVTITRNEDFGGWNRPILLALYISPLFVRAIALPIGMNLSPFVSVAMVWLVWCCLEAEVRPVPAAGR